LEQENLKDKVDDELTRAQAAYGALYVLGIIPGFIFMGFAFDAPGSEKAIMSWVLSLSYPSFVTLVVITAIIANKYHRKGMYKEARRFNKIPFLWIICLIALITIFAIID